MKIFKRLLCLSLVITSVVCSDAVTSMAMTIQETNQTVVANEENEEVETREIEATNDINFVAEGTESTESLDTTESIDTTESTEPIDTTESIESTEPIETTESIESTEPIETIETSEPIEEVVVDASKNSAVYAHTACAPDYEGIALFSDLEIESVSGTDGYYSYSGTTEGVAITAYSGSEQDIIIPDTLDGYTVTSIGESAFANKKSIKTVKMPNTIVEIKGYAFDGCPALTDIDLSENLIGIWKYAFRNCTKLKHIDLPENIEMLDGYIFYNSGVEELYIPKTVESPYSVAYNSNIKKITLEEGMTLIPDYIFSGATKLTTIVVPESIESIGKNAFYNCSSLEAFSVPNKVIAIGEYAFYSCSSLTSFILPENIENVGNYFIAYTKITDINIPAGIKVTTRSFSGSAIENAVFEDGIQTVPNYIFDNVSTLRKVDLPESVTEIGENAFNGDSKLTTINIPDSVTKIGNYAFQSCSLLKKVTLPSRLTRLGYRCFYGTGIEEIVIPETVTYANQAFMNGVLKKATVKAGMTTLPDEIFAYAQNLVSVELPISITTIGRSAFSHAESIETINIPTAVTAIGDYAFAGCYSISELILPSGLTSLGYRAFEDDSIDEILVPKGVTSTNYVFYGSKVKKVIFEDGTKKIQNGVCYDASYLNSVVIPSSVTEIGNSAFYSADRLTSVVIPEGVITIGDYAFYDNATLSSVTLPSSLVKIGKSCFYNCKKLEAIALKEGITYLGDEFIRGTAISSITLPSTLTRANYALSNSAVENVIFANGITAIPSYVCYGANSLKTVSIPNSVTEIGSAAFYGKNNIEEIKLPFGLKTIGDSAFSNCVNLKNLEIPKTVTRLGAYFINEVSIDEITVPASVTNTNDYSFKGSKVKKAVVEVGMQNLPNDIFADAKYLSEVVLPEGITSVGDYAFNGATSLVKINLPDSITSIGYSAFGGCSALESLVLPTGLKTLGRYFINGTAVKELVIPATVNSAYYAFNGSPVEKVFIEDGMTVIPGSMFYNASKLVEIRIPEGITKIQGSTFYGDAALKSISLPVSLTTIESSAFSGCESLTEITLPKNVVSLGSDFLKGTNITTITINGKITSAYSAFEGSNVTAIYLPAGMTTIPSGMFSGAAKLETLTLPKSVTRIEYNAFYNTGALTSLSIPSGVTYIGSCAFSGCGVKEISLPLATTSYGDAFNGSNIEKVILDDSTTTIPTYGFEGARKLVDIELPEGLTTIEKRAFNYAEALRSIVLPDTLTSLGSEAFSHSGIEEINFPASISYASSPFSGSNISKINFDEGVTVIPSNAFEGATKLTAIELPENLRRINSYAFSKSGITSLVIPRTVSSMENALNSSNITNVVFKEGRRIIPVSACAGASELTSVTIPSGVTKICSKAFYGDKKLKQVRFPESMVTVESEAFLNCAALDTLYWPDNLSNISLDSFSGINSDAVAFVSENSPGMFAAVRAGLHVSFTGSYDDKNAVLVDAKNSSYYYNATKISVGKYSTYVVDYKCDATLFNTVKNPYVEIVVPTGMEIGLDYVIMNGQFISADDYTYNSTKRIMQVPVNTASGQIKITLKAMNGGRISTYASMVYEKDGDLKHEAIGVITIDLPTLSMECSSSTSNGRLYIQGVTNPNEKVVIYVNDENVATVKADSLGDYNKTIVLTQMGYNKVKVALESDPKTVVSKNVKYNKQIKIEQFSFFYHSSSDKWSEIDLLDNSAVGRTTISIRPSDELMFKIKFNDNTSIKSVSVVSTKNGQKKYMAAKLTSSGMYVAKGYFNNDRNYIPGQLSLVYTLDNNRKVTIDGADTKIGQLPENVAEFIEECQADDTDVNVQNLTATEISSSQNGNSGSASGVLNNGKTSMKLNIQYSTKSVTKKTEAEYKKQGYIKTTYNNQPAYGKVHDDKVEFIVDNFKDGPIDIAGSTAITFSLAVLEDIGTNNGVCLNQTGTVVGIGINFLGLMGETSKYARTMSAIDARTDLTEADKFRAKAAVTSELSEDYILFGASTLLTVGFAMLFPEAAVAGLVFGIALGFASWWVDENDWISDKFLRYIVDPSGYVYEAVPGNRVKGATAKIYYKKSLDDESATLWDAEDYSQINPEITDEDGIFSWDVPEGFWQVVVEKDGYITGYSEWMEVPPEHTGIEIELISTAAPVVNSVLANTDSLTMVFSQYMNPDSVKNITLTDNQGNNIEYTLLYDDSQEDGDGNVYADQYTFVYNNKISYNSDITIDVPNSVKNYADTSITAYSKTTTVVKPYEIKAVDEVEVQYEGGTSVAVYVENYKSDLVVKCTSDAGAALTTSLSSFDDNGNAVLNISSDVPGNYEIKLSIDGTDVNKVIKVKTTDIEFVTVEDDSDIDTDLDDSMNEDDKPAQPSQPVQPGTQPSQPVQPGTQPSQPGTQPAQPETQPEQPAEPETQPEQPAQPETQPEQPGTQPEQPAQPTQPEKPNVLNSENEPAANDETVKKPSKVKVVSAKSSKKHSLKLRWKKNKDASGYEIQYSTNKKYKKAKVYNCSKNSVTSVTLKNLLSKKTYFVRIRAYKVDKSTGVKTYSDWTTFKKIKVK